VIVRDGLHDADYVANHTHGFDQLTQRLQDYPPDTTARTTGLPAQEIEDLARQFATTTPAAIRLLIGMEHHANGAMASRTVACLPALTGAWNQRGGGLCSTTGDLFDRSLNMKAVKMPELRTSPARSINMVQLGQALTSADPPVKALVVYDTNPAVIAPNQ